MKKHNLDVIVMIFTDGPVVPGSPVPVFGGPYPGFSEPSKPGESDKDLLVKTHLKIFKVILSISAKVPQRTSWHLGV